MHNLICISVIPYVSESVCRVSVCPCISVVRVSVCTCISVSVYHCAFFVSIKCDISPCISTCGRVSVVS